MKNKVVSIKTGIFYGLCAVMLSIIFSMILAYLIYQQTIMPESIQYLSAAISFISVLVCCMIGVKKKSNFIISSIVTAITYFAILLAGKCTFFQNNEIHFGRNAIVCFGSVLVAIIIALFKKDNLKKKVRHR